MRERIRRDLEDFIMPLIRQAIRQKAFRHFQNIAVAPKAPFRRLLAALHDIARMSQSRPPRTHGIAVATQRFQKVLAEVPEPTQSRPSVPTLRAFSHSA